MGKHIKYDRRSEAYVIDPSLGLNRSTKDIILCLCEIGWLYGKVETFLNKLLQSSTGSVMNTNTSHGNSNSEPTDTELFRGVIAQAFAYSVQVSACAMEWCGMK